jgi:integrase
LFAYFAEDRSIRAVTKDDADAFRAYLYQSLKSVNSANTVLKKIKQIFNDAAERELIRANPFKHIKSPIRSNPSRMEFVRREWTRPVVRACPDIEWKIIFLMSRYAGVRVPSELQEFTWSDILWDQKRIRIRDAKRSRPGKPVIRIVPMFPELRPVLAEAYEKRHDDSIYVCPRARGGRSNLRTQMHRIIKRAGLIPWQRTFQNMRSTRETELAENFPMHVVNKWIGNTESVAVQHYLQVTKDHFDKAVKEQFDGEGFDLDIEAIFEEAAQNQAQSASDSQDQAKTGTDSAKSQAAGASETYGQSHHKSLSDKDLRIPPRGVEPLSPP